MVGMIEELLRHVDSAANTEEPGNNGHFPPERH